MNPERRKFIQGALKAAGVVAGWDAFKVLYSLGGDSLVKEAQAENITFISGHVGGAGGVDSSWATWTEVTGPGWGDPNVFIILPEGTSAGDNEEGQGAGLANPDTIWTQTGNVAGASGVGTGKYRLLDGSDDYFTFTSIFGDLIKNQTKWMIVLKVSHIVNVGLDFFIEWEENANGQLSLRIDAGGALGIMYNENSIGQEILATGNNLQFASATPTWIGVHADGTNNVRFWHHNSATRPLLWDDINVNCKATLATAGLNGTIPVSFTYRAFFDNASGGRTIGLRWYYALVASGKTLWE